MGSRRKSGRAGADPEFWMVSRRLLTRRNPRATLDAARSRTKRIANPATARKATAGKKAAPLPMELFSRWWASSDYTRPQSLVAHQREKSSIGNGAAFLPAVAFRAVAGFAIRFVRDLAASSVARGFRRVRRRRDTIQNSGSAPARPDLRRDHINLLVGQHAAAALRKRRHRGAAHSAGNCLAHRRFVRNCQVYGVCKSNSRSAAAFRTVATCAVLRVQSFEIHNLIRRQSLRIFRRPAVREIAAAKQQRSQSQANERMQTHSQGRFSPLSFCRIIPGASIPARIANGRFSRVGIRDCRITTSPATIPKPICEAMNQNQLMWLSSTGFNQPRLEYSKPDQSAGAMSPPRMMGCRGNIGSIAP